MEGNYDIHYNINELWRHNTIMLKKPDVKEKKTYNSTSKRYLD
jgi:hypothetical protein